MAVSPGLVHEAQCLEKGFHHIAGLDEAGRGAWAGPVTAGAVILPLENQGLQPILKDVRDSKLLSARQREALFDIVMETALAAAVGIASPREVEEYNVVGATRLAMRRAIETLALQPDFLLIDGRTLRLKHVNIHQLSMSRGEQESLSIAAASILAKVTRDRLMVEADAQFPLYGFARHKGYGTDAHRTALAAHGPCDIHRRTFEPVMQRLSGMD